MRPQTAFAPARISAPAPKRPLDQYVHELAPRLTRLASFYARTSRLDRDDLLQEAWIGLIEAYARLDERIGSPRHYLIRHARWRLLTYARRAHRHPTLPLKDIIALDDPSLSFAETRQDLTEAALRLSDAQLRTLACLSSGMTWREAAQKLSCSAPNIAYHVRKIREACAARL